MMVSTVKSLKVEGKKTCCMQFAQFVISLGQKHLLCKVDLAPWSSWYSA